MFQTFRRKLLFWFLILISSNLIILFLASRYVREREVISKSIGLIESAYALTLKDANSQQSFFSYETKNESFFRTGKSDILKAHQTLSDSVINILNWGILSHNKLSDLNLNENLRLLKKETSSIDSIFLELVKLIKIRGYKDFNLEGTMRRRAHWLESNGLDIGSILNLRRHEKDYIIRNDTAYVNKFNSLVTVLRKSASKSGQKDSLRYNLTAYQDSFNAMVSLDQVIGIKSNTGLKMKLDEELNALERSFHEVVVKANIGANSLLARLTWIYITVAAVLVLISVSISYILSKKITQPLIELTAYITRFVESNFTAEDTTLTIRSHDEIGKLTRNFTIMRDEVINRLKFFKQKVDERTAELAQANVRLIKLNEANGRFVPKEFLQFLSKESIEEVMLGDQVEHEMTVMFTDIQSFTKISESLNPQENFDFINGYLKEIVPVITKHNGFIDKYIGDSIMALFPGSPDAALLAALEFEKAVEIFNNYLTQQGRDKIRIGCGIHTGHLILGTIGHDHRLETTVISDAVNIASRLEGLTRHYNTRIIASEQTIGKLEHPENFNFRYLETVRVKGKSKSIDIYEILSPLENTIKVIYQKEFAGALQLMKEKKLQEARNIFAELASRHPEDGALQVLLYRCDEYLKDDLPEGWNAVKTMGSKE